MPTIIVILEQYKVRGHKTCFMLNSVEYETSFMTSMQGLATITEKHRVLIKKIDDLKACVLS